MSGVNNVNITLLKQYQEELMIQKNLIWHMKS